MLDVLFRLKNTQLRQEPLKVYFGGMPSPRERKLYATAEVVLIVVASRFVDYHNSKSWLVVQLVCGDTRVKTKLLRM